MASSAHTIVALHPRAVEEGCLPPFRPIASLKGAGSSAGKTPAAIETSRSAYVIRLRAATVDARRSCRRVPTRRSSSNMGSTGARHDARRRVGALDAQQLDQPGGVARRRRGRRRSRLHRPVRTVVFDRTGSPSRPPRTPALPRHRVAPQRHGQGRLLRIVVDDDDVDLRRCRGPGGRARRGSGAGSRGRVEVQALAQWRRSSWVRPSFRGGRNRITATHAAAPPPSAGPPAALLVMLLRSWRRERRAPAHCTRGAAGCLLDEPRRSYDDRRHGGDAAAGGQRKMTELVRPDDHLVMLEERRCRSSTSVASSRGRSRPASRDAGLWTHRRSQPSVPAARARACMCALGPARSSRGAAPWSDRVTVEMRPWSSTFVVFNDALDDVELAQLGRRCSSPTATKSCPMRPTWSSSSAVRAGRRPRPGLDRPDPRHPTGRSTRRSCRRDPPAGADVDLVALFEHG